MLHTVNKSPFEKNSLRTCLRLARNGSDILLIQDAVYAALPDTEVAVDMIEAVRRHNVYALKPDLMARGLDQGSLIGGIEPIDYDRFVELAVKNDSVQSWL